MFLRGRPNEIDLPIPATMETDMTDPLALSSALLGIAQTRLSPQLCSPPGDYAGCAKVETAQSGRDCRA